MEELRFFTRLTILGFSIIMSPFFGAVLFAQNLNEIGRKNEIVKVILFAFLWNVMAYEISRRITVSMYAFLIVNFIGGLILIYPIWNYYFKEISEYKNRPIWGPLIVLVAIMATVYFLSLMQSDVKMD